MSSVRVGAGRSIRSVTGAEGGSWLQVIEGCAAGNTYLNQQIRVML